MDWANEYISEALDFAEEEDARSYVADEPELSVAELQMALAVAESRVHVAETRAREVDRQLEAVLWDRGRIAELRALVLEYDRRALRDFVEARILDGRIPGGGGEGTDYERLAAAGFFADVNISDDDGSQGFGYDPDEGFPMWRDVQGCAYVVWDGEVVARVRPPPPPSHTPEECLEYFVMTRILGEGFGARVDGTEEQALIDAGWYRGTADALGWCRDADDMLIWREQGGCAYMLDGRPVFEMRTLATSSRRRVRAHESAAARGAAGGGGRGRGGGGVCPPSGPSA